MTKAEFIENLANLYSIANRGDVDRDELQARFPELDWITPEMASVVCQGFDKALECSVFTDEDRRRFHDELVN